MSRYQPLWDFVLGCGCRHYALTFNDIADIIGSPLNRSIMLHNSELLRYGYTISRISERESTVFIDKVDRSVPLCGRRRPASDG